MGGTRKPVSPSVIILVVPPTHVLIIDLPQAVSSIMTVAHGPGQSDGASPNRLRFQACMTASCGQLLKTSVLGGGTVGTST